MVYCVNLRMRQTKFGRLINFPFFFLLQLCFIGYPTSARSSCLSVLSFLPAIYDSSLSVSSSAIVSSKVVYAREQVCSEEFNPHNRTQKS